MDAACANTDSKVGYASSDGILSNVLSLSESKSGVMGAETSNEFKRGLEHTESASAGESCGEDVEGHMNESMASEL